jgi:receptor protein-tyrosine kinase/non-specific protein-tyrosine kinase
MMNRIQNILDKAERDGTVRRIHTASDSRGATALAVDEALVIEPSATPAAESIGATAIAPAPLAGPRVIADARLDARLVVAFGTDEAAAEQYRSLRTRILHADTGAQTSLLLITSPGRNEGKTLTAANLGLTMAQEYQQRICVVDADLRHPQMHRLFGLPDDAPGLADVLVGSASLEDALVTIEESHITVLPAGRSTAHPAELFGTTAMRRVLETLRSQFDRVVIDAPAAAPLADVGILAPMVDSVLLVVRAGVTSKPAIQSAVNAIEQDKLLGVVLNEAA